MGKLLCFLMRTLFMVLAVELTTLGSIRVELQEEVKAPLKRIKDASYQYEGEPQSVNRAGGFGLLRGRLFYGIEGS